MVKASDLSIEWTLSARLDVKDILSYYKKKSPKGHQLVKAAILENIKQIAKSPVIFKADALKNANDSNDKSIYRISYKSF